MIKNPPEISDSEKVFHIYAKDRCLYHNLGLEDFEEKWEMLNIMVGILKTDYQIEDLLGNCIDIDVESGAVIDKFGNICYEGNIDFCGVCFGLSDGYDLEGGLIEDYLRGGIMDDVGYGEGGMIEADIDFEDETQNPFSKDYTGVFSGSNPYIRTGSPQKSEGGTIFGK